MAGKATGTQRCSLSVKTLEQETLVSMNQSVAMELLTETTQQKSSPKKQGKRPYPFGEKHIGSQGNIKIFLQAQPTQPSQPTEPDSPIVVEGEDEMPPLV